MNDKIEEWLHDGVLITDGGWGTELQKRGLPPGAHPDLWNLSFPERVESVATAYIAAGSDVILTNTFGGTKFMLNRHGVGDQVRELNRAGVAISRRAADNETGRPVRVFASMGPSGILLMTGEVGENELYEGFREQAEALCEGGADAIVVETMSDTRELALAVRAAKSTGLPVVASMTFDSGKKHDRTMMGTTPEQAVSAMVDAGADVLGSNCGQGIDGFVEICRRYRAANSSLPIWMKGNAGLPEMVNGQTIYRQDPVLFAQTAKLLVQEGAGFIGGCCGTSPEFIVALRNELKAS